MKTAHLSSLALVVASLVVLEANALAQPQGSDRRPVGPRVGVAPVAPVRRPAPATTVRGGGNRTENPSARPPADIAPIKPRPGLELPGRRIGGFDPKPPVGGFKPPVGGFKPPVGDIKPPVGGLRPPVGGFQPPFDGGRPGVIKPPGIIEPIRPIDPPRLGNPGTPICPPKPPHCGTPVGPICPPEPPHCGTPVGPICPPAPPCIPRPPVCGTPCPPCPPICIDVVFPVITVGLDLTIQTVTTVPADAPIASEWRWIPAGTYIFRKLIWVPERVETVLVKGCTQTRIDTRGRKYEIQIGEPTYQTQVIPGYYEWIDETLTLVEGQWILVAA